MPPYEVAPKINIEEDSPRDQVENFKIKIDMDKYGFKYIIANRYSDPTTLAIEFCNE